MGRSLARGLRQALDTAGEHTAARVASATGRAVADVRAELADLCESVATDAARDAGSARRAPHPQHDEYAALLRSELIGVLSLNTPTRMSGAELVSVLAALEPVAPPHETTPAAQSHVVVRSEALSGMLEIAHDMRSPLAAILLLVEPIRRGQRGPVTPLQERQLGIIYGAALSLSTLANDIIEAARGRVRAQSAARPFSLGRIIQDVAAVVRPIAEEKQLQLVLTASAVDGRTGNSAAIQRVLLNLTSNALKYTERGSVSVGCSDLSGSEVEFWVHDTGGGIPDNVIAVLFDEFRPGANGLAFSSSGLGLAICRSLLESMGGTLRVETSRETGTRFSFVLSLPLAPSADSNTPRLTEHSA